MGCMCFWGNFTGGSTHGHFSIRGTVLEIFPLYGVEVLPKMSTTREVCHILEFSGI